MTFFSLDPVPKGGSNLKALWKSHLTNVRSTLYLVRTGFSKIEPVTCKVLTFLPKNTGIKLKTMHARGIYEKVGQAT